MTTNEECPICMDAIDIRFNYIITECGHKFHCSCLMQNATINGFGCPYCRQSMAKLPNYEDLSEDDSESEGSDDDDSNSYDENEYDYSDYTNEINENNILTTFRMFHQQINGETVEDDIKYSNLPDEKQICKKLQEMGVTYDDLIRDKLDTEKSDFRGYYVGYYTNKRQQNKLNARIIDILDELEIENLLSY